jgi:hypothetical protein
MKTTRKTVQVIGTKANRFGIMTTTASRRKNNPIRVEISFTSSVDSKQLERFFFCDGKTERDCILGIAETFNLQIV